MEDHYKISLGCQHPLLKRQCTTNRLIIDELDYDMSDELSRLESLARGLNLDQYRVFRLVIDAHHQGHGGLFFLIWQRGHRKSLSVEYHHI